MTPVRAIVLQSPAPNGERIQALVDRCVLDDVALIAISGRNAFELEAKVDWLIIGDGTTPERFISTSAHADDDDHDALGDALRLARSFSGGNGYVDRVVVIGHAVMRYRSTRQVV